MGLLFLMVIQLKRMVFVSNRSQSGSNDNELFLGANQMIDMDRFFKIRITTSSYLDSTRKVVMVVVVQMVVLAVERKLGTSGGFVGDNPFFIFLFLVFYIFLNLIFFFIYLIR